MSHARVIGIQHHLLAMLAFLRACSGLFAVIALLAIAAGTGRLTQYGATETTASPPPATFPDPIEQTRTTTRSQPEPLETMVFYWVTTPEQASRVDAMENDVRSDDWRSYRVIYARDHGELKAAQQALVGYMLASDETVQVSLIDARDW